MAEPAANKSTRQLVLEGEKHAQGSGTHEQTPKEGSTHQKQSTHPHPRNRTHNPSRRGNPSAPHKVSTPPRGRPPGCPCPKTHTRGHNPDAARTRRRAARTPVRATTTAATTHTQHPNPTYQSHTLPKHVATLETKHTPQTEHTPALPKQNPEPQQTGPPPRRPTK